MNANILSGAGFSLSITNTGSTAGVALTPDAAAHTKGTIVELSSALPFDVHGFTIGIIPQTGGAGTLTDYAVSLYLGAAASEVAVLDNLCCGSNSFNSIGAYAPVYVPLYLPAGARLSAAAQFASTTQPPVHVIVNLFPVAFAGQAVFSRATTYGFDAANTRGVLSNSGAVANTKNTPVEIDAAIANPIKAAILMVQGNNTSGAASNALADIMRGAASAEVVVFSDLYYRLGGNNALYIPGQQFCGYCDIPAGERLSVRHQSSSTTSNTSTRATRFSVIGFD